MTDKIASALAAKRWKKATAEDRAEAAQTMLDAKSAKQRSAIAKKAAAARWGKKATKGAK